MAVKMKMLNKVILLTFQVIFSTDADEDAKNEKCEWKNKYCTHTK